MFFKFVAYSLWEWWVYTAGGRCYIQCMINVVGYRTVTSDDEEGVSSCQIPQGQLVIVTRRHEQLSHHRNQKRQPLHKTRYIFVYIIFIWSYIIYYYYFRVHNIYLVMHHIYYCLLVVYQWLIARRTSHITFSTYFQRQIA